MSTQIEELHLEAVLALLLPPADPDQDEEWQAAAICKETDPEVFFPEKGERGREAKMVCRRCPVADQCLEWALAEGEPHGVWGGMTPRERQRTIVERRKTNRPAIDLAARKRLIAAAAERGTAATDLAEQLGCSVNAANQALLRHRKSLTNGALGAA